MNKTKIIFTIIFSIFFILIISTYYNAYEQKKYIQIKHEQSFSILQQMIDGKIIFYRKMFSTRIRNLVYNYPNFKKSIVTGDLKLTKDVMDKAFKLLKRENKYTKVLHYVNRQNVTIYRAHKPSNVGDDLTTLRPIMRYVNEHKRAKYGFEAGLHAIAYRVDIPIIYDGKCYGVLEYGIDPNLFLDDLTAVSNYIESTILINKDEYKKLVSTKKASLKDQHMKSKKYKVIHTSPFFKNIDIDSLKENVEFYHNGEYYVPFFYKLLNFDGSSKGKFLIAVNTTVDNIRYEDVIKLSIVNLIVLIFIIFLIVYYAFGYYENKITTLTQQEKENERMLYQQSKMASMGEMIGNIAHQWRQPLSVISTVASGIIVQKEYNMFDESTLNESMDKIVDQTQYMSKTINDFRDFFKQDRQKQDFELTQIINQNISLVEHSYKNNNIILTKKLEDNIVVFGYPNELTQALVNILNNAKDQLVKQEKLDVRLVEIHTYINEENNVIITITDNGGGIPDDVLPKIFEPYFTTKHQSQGTGIGLYMTHEIIVKHFKGQLIANNSTISYNDCNYIGAQFKIVLPLK